MFKTFFSNLLISFLMKSSYSEIEVCPYTEDKIAGVEYSYIQSHFYMAKVVLWNEDYKGGFTYCSGIIINESYVLTAAHCLMNPKCTRDKTTREFSCNMIEPSKYDVVVGSSYVLSKELSIVRKGKEIKIHPNFKEHHDYSCDVGFIIVDRPLPINQTENKSVGNKILPPYYSKRLNYTSFRRDVEVMIVTFGSSPCSSVFTKLARRENYQIGYHDKFQRLKIIKTLIPDVSVCQELMGAYIESGIPLNAFNVVCIKTDFQNKDCEDLSGSAIVTVPDTQNELYGIILQPLSCNTDQHLFYLRTSSVIEFTLGKPFTYDYD